ncbi:uncharacterized protein J3R85_007065 [Psidium guajava]|nr:uncharacterized protein J3R85_007065 [Psidium guajava]
MGDGRDSDSDTRAELQTIETVNDNGGDQDKLHVRFVLIKIDRGCKGFKHLNDSIRTIGSYKNLRTQALDCHGQLPFFYPGGV